MGRRDEYIQKFKDPRWQKKRLEIFERDKWQCQVCLAEGDTLNIHHKYYCDDCEPWEYDDNALVTLCERCHEYEKDYLKSASSRLIKAMKEPGMMAGDINWIAQGFECADFICNAEIMADVIFDILVSPSKQEPLVDQSIADIKRTIKEGDESTANKKKRMIVCMWEQMKKNLEEDNA
jgi:hypothetical protein